MTGPSRITRAARWLASLLAFAVFIVACGGDDDGPPQPVQADHPPTISNLRYTPKSVLQVPGGSVTITGTFDFGDPGGDIASLRVTSSAGADTTTATPQMQGVVAGTLSGAVVVSVDKVGKYTFEVSVSDSRGAVSGKLSGSFEVLAPSVIPTDHPPGIVNLGTSPSFVHQALAQSQTVKASVEFADAGGDVVAFRLVGSWGTDQLVPVPDLGGITSGTASFEFAVPVGQAATHTIEVQAVDGRGAVSNALATAVEVLALDPARHLPTIANLRYAPLSAFQNIGGSVTVQCTVEFADALGDVTAMRLVTSAGTELTATTAGLAGLKSGTATAAFAVPATQAGKVGFEVWVLDSRGSASNRLPGTFEILPPDTWITSSSPGVLNAIAFSNGRYVGVGASGLVASSPDATTWTSQSVGGSALYSVAGTGSRFSAVGESAGRALIIASIDGGAWSLAYEGPPSSVLYKVIWAGTRFIAVGQERGSDGKLYALILTSTDALGWTRSPQVIELGDFGIHPRGLTSVASSGSVYIAIGLDLQWSPVAWKSTDALTWEGPLGLSNDAIWAFAPSDVTYGNGRFVAVNAVPSFSGDAPVLVSTDGVAWRADAMVANLPVMNAIAGGSAGFVAVGPGYRMASTDGLTWSLTPMTDCGNGVTWDGNRFVAVGAAICKSP